MTVQELIRKLGDIDNPLLKVHLIINCQGDLYYEEAEEVSIETEKGRFISNDDDDDYEFPLVVLR